MVELDVHLTADKIPIIYHNFEVNSFLYDVCTSIFSQYKVAVHLVVVLFSQRRVNQISLIHYKWLDRCLPLTPFCLYSSPQRTSDQKNVSVSIPVYRFTYKQLQDVSRIGTELSLLLNYYNPFLVLCESVCSIRVD